MSDLPLAAVLCVWMPDLTLFYEGFVFESHEQTLYGVCSNCR